MDRSHPVVPGREAAQEHPRLPCAASVHAPCYRAEWREVVPASSVVQVARHAAVLNAEIRKAEAMAMSCLAVHVIGSARYARLGNRKPSALPLDCAAQGLVRKIGLPLHQ